MDPGAFAVWAPPGGAFYVAHTLTGDDAATLTLNVAEHRVRRWP
jgi:hypothetical protein